PPPASSAVAAAPDPIAKAADPVAPPVIVAPVDTASLFAAPEAAAAPKPVAAAAGRPRLMSLLDQKVRLGAVVIPLPLALATVVLSIGALGALLGLGAGFAIGSARTAETPP